MPRLLLNLIRWTALVCVPGGVLWALSPLGVQLSEKLFKTPDVFWKMFPSAVLLLMVGLVGLYAWQAGRSGWPGKVGFLLAFLGLVLILAGDVGKFWLGLDDVYIMAAPAYRALRIGLLVLAVGSVVFGIFAARDRALPIWGALPFVIGSWAGLISFLRDFGSFGAALWIAFGVGWVWLGFSLLVDGVVSFLRKRRTARRTAS